MKKSFKPFKIYSSGYTQGRSSIPSGEPMKGKNVKLSPELSKLGYFGQMYWTPSKDEHQYYIFDKNLPYTSVDDAVAHGNTVGHNEDADGGTSSKLPEELEDKVDQALSDLMNPPLCPLCGDPKCAGSRKSRS